MKVPSSSARRAPVTRVSSVSRAPWEAETCMVAAPPVSARVRSMRSLSTGSGWAARAPTYADTSGWNHGGVCLEVISAP